MPRRRIGPLGVEQEPIFGLTLANPHRNPLRGGQSVGYGMATQWQSFVCRNGLGNRCGDMLMPKTIKIEDLLDSLKDDAWRKNTGFSAQPSPHFSYDREGLSHG